MRKLLTALIFNAFAASSVWASITSCPGISATPTETLAVINANIPTGCQIVDVQFSNFTSTPVGQTLLTEMLNTSTGGTVAANTITGLIADFDAPTLWALTPNNTTTSVFNYEGTVDQTITPPTTGQWSINQISLIENFNPGNASQIKNGDSVTVLMQWCPGATVFTVGCANLQFIQGVLTKNPTLTLTYTNSAGNGNSFLDVSSFSDTTTFAVRNTLTFVGTANGSAFPLTGISNGFDSIGAAGITPEPSTFVMFGIALTGVALLRFRRRKTA